VVPFKEILEKWMQIHNDRAETSLQEGRRKLLERLQRELVAHTYNLATQEAEISLLIQSQPQGNGSQDPISKKTHHKKGLVEWLKV
jgi:hypothetical protein